MDGKTWNSASSGKRTKVGRITPSNRSETPQHKWRFRINMTLRNIRLHSEFSNKTLDLKCVTLSIILRWKEFAICTSPIIHLVCLHPPPPHPLNKNFASPLFLISSGHHSFPRRNWKECLCKVLGANKVYYSWEDVKIGDHPLVPKVFSISNMVVTGRTKNPYCYVAQ